MKQIEYIPGDWVKASDQLCRVKEVFVNNFTDEYEYIFVYRNGVSSRVGIGYIEPVPLTPEILKENGWEWDDHDFRLGALDLFPVGNYFILDGFWDKKIKYVHQLQHLLFGLDDNSEIKI